MFNSMKPSDEDLPSSAQLIKSTIIAFIVAAVILLIIVLPAEYGVDPTGIGEAIGLKKMGEIKTSLEKEIVEQKKTNMVVKTEIKNKNTETTDPEKNDTVQKKKTQNISEKNEKSLDITVESSLQLKTEVFEHILKPGDAIEVKLKMKKGNKAQYKWICENGLLNHNTHGDGPGKKFFCYKKGLSIKSDKGEIVAKFDGSHGWFWRNRDKNNVKVKLEVSGNFQEIKRVR